MSEKEKASTTKAKAAAKAASVTSKMNGVFANAQLRKRLIVGGVMILAFALGAPLIPEIFRQAKFVAGGRGPASKGGRHEKAAPAQPGMVANVIHTYEQAYDQTVGSVTEKLKAIQQAEAKNTWLALENANLKLEVEKLKFSCSADQNKKETTQAKMKLSKEAGSRVGRTLASIEFTPPANLQPAQLYVLALSYLKGREDEKAAYLLTQLTGMEDHSIFKTAQNYMLTGVLWYRMKNYKLADEYFDLALKLPESKDSIAYQARARLWKAVVSRKLSKETKVQFWLTELVDHHPHSMEAEWVNPGTATASSTSRSKEAERAPAASHH